MTQLPPEPANQPIRFKRDPETGLIIGLTYHYTPDGRIDWRAMCPKRYLYIAKERIDDVVREQAKPLAEVDILAVRNQWLRIRVAGLNELAHIRGVTSCTYPHLICREGFASAVCEMTFLPSEESGGYPETWSGIGSACRTSMDKAFLPYLEAFAENRSFARCVKRALSIDDILSDIEVGGDGRDAAADAAAEEAVANQPAPGGFQPCDELARICRSHKPAIPFDALKAAAVKLNADTPAERANERVQGDPSAWKGFGDIQAIDAWLMINKISEADKAVKSGKKG